MRVRRDIHICTGIEKNRLRVSINKRVYHPGKASSERLDRILTKVKPNRVFIDTFGPSVLFSVYPPQ